MVTIILKSQHKSSVLYLLSGKCFCFLASRQWEIIVLLLVTTHVPPTQALLLSSLICHGPPSHSLFVVFVHVRSHFMCTTSHFMCVTWILITVYVFVHGNVAKTNITTSHSSPSPRTSALKIRLHGVIVVP